MNRQSALKFVGNYFGWFLISSVILLAIPLLFSATLIDGTKMPMRHDIVRDIGIAFLVAAIVGTVYDIHARTRFDLETIGGILATTMGDIVSPDVWKAVKVQVLEKKVLRRNVNIHLDLFDDPQDGLPPGAKVFRLELDYDVCGLRSVTQSVEIVHSLDAHIRSKSRPKFTFIQVGDEIFPPTCPDNGVFTKEIRVTPGQESPQHVTTMREEITYAPGSYTLAMTELTTGVTLHLQQVPPDIEVSVNVYPHIEDLHLAVDQPVSRPFRDVVLLPGQAIEFRFKRKGD